MPQLIEGSPVYIQGSGSKPYELKNTGGTFSCTCPAWRNQGVSIDKRTCKHLKKHCGDAAETARVGGSAQAPTRTATATTGATNTNATTAPVIATATTAPTSATTLHDPQCLTLGRLVTADIEYANSILSRVWIEKRDLRQDEKAKLFGPPILLANNFEDFEDLDPTGWWCSEKLDGVRAYWDGQNFISRQGNIYHAPDWFKVGLPKNEILDGELWIGRQMFQRTVSIVKRLDWGEGAKEVKFVIFDVPSLKEETFESRLNSAHNLVLAMNQPRFLALGHSLVESRKHLLDELNRVSAVGAEGLMIRKPKSLYESCRSNTLLKVKPFQDAEGLVIGHKPGKKKHKGVLGAVVIRMSSGVEFDLGTGFSDEERRSPPKVGDMVTFRFTELTNDGKPKCTSFISVRDYE